MSRQSFLIILMAMGCVGGPSVDGSWTGSWTGGGTSGNVVFDLTQSDQNVSGTASFTGSPCFTNGGVTGTVHDNEFFGSVTAGQIRVDFDSTIATNEVDGSFSAIAAGACTGSMGSFTVRP